MRRSASRALSLAALGGLWWIPGLASATVFPALGTPAAGGPEVDLTSLQITNDASNIYFTINLASGGNLTTNHYANYEMGFQMNGGAGGQMLINGTYGTAPAAGNPYGNSVGISSGENYFMGAFLAGSTYSGGAQLYSYSPSGWSQVGSNATVTQVNTGSPSLSFQYPLSALGLSVGNSFKFDVWTSFGSPQGAYDALDSTSNTPNTGGAPYSGGSYDSATASGSAFASTIYTVAAVPEPASAALVCLSGIALSIRRRGRL